MLDMFWYVQIKTDGKKYRLATVEDISVEKSVKNLADIATITLPEAVMGQVLNMEGKIKRGSEVLIQLGYDNKDNLKTEFSGFVQKITNNGSLIIHCEDALFLFRKSVPDVELKPTTVKKIAQYLVQHTDNSYSVACSFDIPYDKFVINQATAYDVLKKLQEETQADIWFDTENKTLHIHPPYLEGLGKKVKYSMHLNIESSSLEYKEAIDKKVEVTVASTDKNGKVKTITAGTPGGDKIKIKVGAMSEEGMKKTAQAALVKNNYDGYDGSFDGWLVPFVQPGYSAVVDDKDYPHKKGRYYVESVKTQFNSSGGKRTITLGIKLGNG